MNHESYYKISKTSWGIRVGFKGNIDDNYHDAVPDNATLVTGSICFLLTIREENRYVHQCRSLLENGILWVSHLLPDKPTLIVIDDIDFNFCDFQSEGFFFGIADFVCSYYNVAMPVYHYEYDNKQRRYSFWFDPADTVSEELLYKKETVDIKYENHFKLNIALKDKIVFEAEMYARNIPFHLDDNPMAYTRYFLLDEDRGRIDAVLIETGIIAGTDTIRMNDYGDSKKVHKVYLYVAIVVVLLFAAATGITLLSNN